MDIKKIDRNFETSFEAPSDVEWFSVREEPFKTYGIFYSESEGLYRRMPKDVADATSPGVAFLSLHSAGGRVRFATDSPYVIVRAVEAFEEPFSHMAICGKHGFTLIGNNRFCGTYMPQYRHFVEGEKSGTIVFDGMKTPWLDGEEAPYEMELHFPLYCIVKEVYVGLKKGCKLTAPKPYKHEKPVLFYGSSITQGGCASKPGDDYVARLSRMLDTDFINLGFSGSARAEDVMIDYLSSLDPSVFVMDYDHNAPDAQHLEKTHHKLYKAFRSAHPSTPIIMMTMPTIEGYEAKPWNTDRYKTILASFDKARASGDENVYLVDCYGCFGKLYNGEWGTVDDCHPDSLGFLRMAEAVYPVLSKLLK